MLIITHHNEIVISIAKDEQVIPEFNGLKLLPTILELASKFSEYVIVWVSQELFSFLNISYLKENAISQNELHTFEPHNFFVPREIGYAEDTLFINVNKRVQYPTWLSCNSVGAVRAKTLCAINTNLSTNTSFNYFLNAISKTTMSQGLRCYSNPLLLNDGPYEKNTSKGMTSIEFFTFIKQHYKKRWLFLVSLQLLIFENRFTFFTAILCLFVRKHKCLFNLVDIVNTKKLERQSIDVIIPTIGRKKYLYDVLIDLKNQNLVPTTVIIVEQNANSNAISELDYLKDESWPFKIEHSFIHQTGACNARNIALEKASSDWVFFADDDVRIPRDTIREAIHICNSLYIKAITLSCLQTGEKEHATNMQQWIGFGSGSSIVHKSALENLKFNMGYEHGHGEDGDFGMQLRNKGFDVFYVPSLQLKHIKAPVGGFRQKKIHPWDGRDVTPKPSPTVMLYKIKHLTKEQLNSYKFTLFTKYFKSQSVKNPLVYLKKMNKAWKESMQWANQLKNTYGN